MLSKAGFKRLKRLKQKKYRSQEKRYIVEGLKNVQEALEHDQVIELYLTKSAFTALGQVDLPVQEQIIDDKELNELSSLQHPEGALAVIAQKDSDISLWTKEAWWLILDNVRDPGNVGTILRVIDWFGLGGLILTEGSAEVYNPKCVRASMGAIHRVSVITASTESILHHASQHEIDLFVADMQGEPLHSWHPGKGGGLILGQESHGPQAIWNEVGRPVTIPKGGLAESLNVAIAAGIFANAVFEHEIP